MMDAAGRRVLPELLSRIATGEITLPVWADRPAVVRGYPPAFVPLWSVFDESIGYFRHWFTDRPPSIVKLVRKKEEGRLALIELARTPEQLVIILTMQAYYLRGEPAPVRTELWDIARLTDADFEALRSVLERGRGLMTALRSHPRFGSDSPLGCFCEVGYERLDDAYSPEYRGTEAYTGTFLTDTYLSLEALRRTSGCELGVYSNPAFDDLASSVPWIAASFTPGAQPKLFPDFLSKGDVGSAWMTLNSPGWRREQALHAIDALAKTVSDPTFDDLVLNWRQHHLDDQSIWLY
jgi:hypothetical protein